MSIVALQVPDVKGEAESRPSHCAACKGAVLQRWGGEAKRVRDLQLQMVRVLELDGSYTRGWGQRNPVLVAVDLGEGQPMAIGYVDELFPQAVRRCLESLVKRLGVSVIVTDDLIHYKTMAEKLDLAHRY